MPLTDAEHFAWSVDPRNDPYRTMLVQLDYSAPGNAPPPNPEIVGHGRKNSSSSLPPVQSLSVTTYQDGVRDIIFTQPVLQPGFVWQIWINDDEPYTVTGGSSTVTIANATAIHVSVNTAHPDGRYSTPFIADVPANPTLGQAYSGAAGDWDDVGEGTGTSGEVFIPVEGDGTVHLAAPIEYIDPDTNQPYDDWIAADEFIMQANLERFDGLGELVVYNPEHERFNWEQLRWRGYSARIYEGDVRWPFADFRPVAETLIDNHRRADARTYTVDLMDGGRHLSQKFMTGADTPVSLSAKSAIAYVMALASLPNVSYVNVPASRDWDVDLVLKEDQTVEDVIRLVCASIGAELRHGRNGYTEVFIPDATVAPALYVTDDDILEGGLQEIDVTNAYREVVVQLADESDVSGITGAATGQLNEKYTIKTALKNTADANVLLAEALVYYGVGHRRWLLDLRRLTSQIEVGTRLGAQLEDLDAVGLVTDVQRMPLSFYSEVELTV